MITLRPVTDDDQAWVVALRNAVADVSSAGTTVTKRWFDAIKLCTFAIEEGDAIVGYLIARPVTEVSIALGRSARGKGIGPDALRQLRRTVGPCVATIQPTNYASRRAFDKAGFAEHGHGLVLVRTP